MVQGSPRARYGEGRLSEHAHDEVEVDPGDEVVAAGAGQVAAGLDQVQQGVLHLQVRLHSQLESLLGEGVEALGLGDRPGERLDDLAGLLDGVQGGADLQCRRVLRLLQLDLRGREIAPGLLDLPAGPQPVEEGEGEVDPGVPDRPAGADVPPSATLGFWTVKSFRPQSPRKSKRGLSPDRAMFRSASRATAMWRRSWRSGRIFSAVGEGGLVGRQGRGARFQRPLRVHVPFLDRQEEAEAVPGHADGVLRAEEAGPGVLDGHLGREHVVVGGGAQGELPAGLLQVPLLLLQVLPGDGVQLPGQEDVVERGGDVPLGGLLREPQLVVGDLESHLRRPDGGADLAPGEEDLAHLHARRPDVLLHGEVHVLAERGRIEGPRALVVLALRGAGQGQLREGLGPLLLVLPLDPVAVLPGLLHVAVLIQGDGHGLLERQDARGRLLREAASRGGGLLRPGTCRRPPRGAR